MARHNGILIIAISALFVGALVYVYDRQPEFVYFLPAWLSFENQTVSFFGKIGNYLPTFIHVYAFILLTVVVTVPTATKLIPVCLAWFSLDSLFEFAQLNPIAQWIGNHIPIWFDGIPFVENTKNYFLMGTFDVFDLISIIVGTLAAYLTAALITRRA